VNDAGLQLQEEHVDAGIDAVSLWRDRVDSGNVIVIEAVVKVGGFRSAEKYSYRRRHGDVADVVPAT